MLNDIQTVIYTDPALGRRGYPSIKIRDNGDGTYQSKLDLAHMSPSQKLMALVDKKTSDLSGNLGIVLS